MKPWEMMRRFGPPSSGGGSGGGSGTTAALLRFDGADGSTTFTDETGKIWTPTEGVVINAANAKYGTGCGYFPYENDPNGYMTTPYSPDFDFGDGDFTIQFWHKDADLYSGYYGPVICLDSIGGTRGWLVLKNTVSGRMQLVVNTSTGTYVAEDTVTAPAVNTHYAACREGGTLRLYRNGVQVASTAISGAANAPNVPCVIGALWGLSAPVNTHRLWGYLDDLKVTKGACEYPGGTTFTPPGAL